VWPVKFWGTRGDSGGVGPGKIILVISVAVRQAGQLRKNAIFSGYLTNTRKNLSAGLSQVFFCRRECNFLEFK